MGRSRLEYRKRGKGRMSGTQDRRRMNDVISKLPSNTHRYNDNDEEEKDADSNGEDIELDSSLDDEYFGYHHTSVHAYVPLQTFYRVTENTDKMINNNYSGLHDIDLIGLAHALEKLPLHECLNLNPELYSDTAAGLEICPLAEEKVEERKEDSELNIIEEKINEVFSMKVKEEKVSTTEELQEFIDDVLDM